MKILIMFGLQNYSIVDRYFKEVEPKLIRRLLDAKGKEMILTSVITNDDCKQDTDKWKIVDTFKDSFPVKITEDTEFGNKSLVEMISRLNEVEKIESIELCGGNLIESILGTIYLFKTYLPEIDLVVRTDLCFDIDYGVYDRNKVWDRYSDIMLLLEAIGVKVIWGIYSNEEENDCN